jgi:hypothetical protein
MPWMPTTEAIEQVLQRISGIPASGRIGRIDGVMVKTFNKWADQRWC